MSQKMQQHKRRKLLATDFVLYSTPHWPLIQSVSKTLNAIDVLNQNLTRVRAVINIINDTDTVWAETMENTFTHLVDHELVVILHPDMQPSEKKSKSFSKPDVTLE